MAKVKKISAAKSRFIEHTKKVYDESLTEDQKKERRMKKLEQVFGILGDKQNRYLFYCPDIPFACTLAKTIYEHVNMLNKLGFNASILHEYQGFKPAWLYEDYVKETPVDYLSKKDSKGTFDKPNYVYRTTDTIIVPDGFWTVMEGFAEIKNLQKVVLAFSHGGLATAEPGLDWGYLGFNNVICVSERVKEDYSKVWPHLTYHVVPYKIDQSKFTPLDKTKRTPTIGLSARSREDAQSIINIFYSKYPFLDMFEFKVLKKHNTEVYREIIQECALTVLVDEKGGHPALPLESIACDVPCMAVYGRGLDHLTSQEGVIWIEGNDSFVVAESIANFCFEWLQKETVEIKDKSILNNYSEEEVKKALVNTFNSLQQGKIEYYAAVKQAIESGKLTDEVSQEVEPKMEIV